MDRIKDRIEAVLADIQAASPHPSLVTLVAVSKRKPLELLLEAFAAGQRVFGENRVQEARDKRPGLPEPAQIHLIGPLQANKAKYCPHLFSTIHSLDRWETAQALEEQCLKKDAHLDVLVQMNLTGEDSKSGLSSLEDLQRLNDQLQGLTRLHLRGLMTMGHPDQGEADTRKVFARLAKMREAEAQRLGLKDQMTELSMGMSDDLLWALQEGATLVRVGSRIFGHRQ